MKPVKKPVKTAKTVKALKKPVKTVKALKKPVKPVKALKKPVKALKKPVKPVKPVKTVKALKEPVKTVKALKEPVKTVKALKEPVKTVKALKKPVNSRKYYIRGGTNLKNLYVDIYNKYNYVKDETQKRNYSIDLIIISVIILLEELEKIHEISEEIEILKEFKTKRIHEEELKDIKTILENIWLKYFVPYIEIKGSGHDEYFDFKEDMLEMLEKELHKKLKANKAGVVLKIGEGIMIARRRQ